ncbi:MAG: hypothetical protein EHM42_09820 [Planctomycetaceae bacterium]|nr:MAG: hypothetical protein EHM42_10885 [Planctomycetaceae bacterium]RPI82133.1 MAG: hypothetical protein EHM42_09820 [Planctomycetaceae bacterium]
MIQQAMLAAWLEEFIRKVVALLRDPDPNRPPPPPWPETPPKADDTLAKTRDRAANHYSGYTLHLDRMQHCHDWLATCPGPLPPPPGSGGIMP